MPHHKYNHKGARWGDAEDDFEFQPPCGADVQLVPVATRHNMLLWFKLQADPVVKANNKNANES